MPDNNTPTAEVKVPETKATTTKVPETKAMADKVPETKGFYQVISDKLSEGALQILFQMEIDSKGSTTFTVFRGTKMDLGEGSKS